MSMPVYILAFALAASGIVLILRFPVRRDYLELGRLRPVTILLQYGMTLIWVAFGWLNMPRSWPDISVGLPLRIPGFVLAAAGLLLFLAAFLDLGAGRSHGLHRDGVHETGLYGVTRNPQIVGFGTFMLGFTLLWPTWRMVGVLALLGILSHTMVLTEEEFLEREAGDEYRAFFRRVPRYLRLRPRR
jgi:protein-S-isoprenylcysteine O-methyltransferase Ste14